MKKVNRFVILIYKLRYVFMNGSFYFVEFEINLQACFEEGKNEFSVEQIKSTMLSVYDVPMSFQLKSPLKSLFFVLFFRLHIIIH